MNKDNLEIYLRKNDKIIVNKEGQIQKRKITVNEDGIGNEALEELAIKTLELNSYFISSRFNLDLLIKSLFLFFFISNKVL